MKIQIKRENIFTYTGIISLLSYFLLSISSILDFLSFLINPFLIIGTILLLISISLKTIKLKYLLIKGILLLIAFYSYILCKDPTIFITFLIIFSIKQEDIPSILKIIFYFWTLALIIHFFLYFLNYLFGIEVPIYYSENGTKRFTLFLGHPNFTSEIIFWISLIKVYQNDKKQKKNINTIIFLIISMLLNYFITRSRTTLLFMILFLIYRIFLEKDNQNIMKTISKYIFPLAGFLSILFAYFFQNLSLINSINKLVSGRFGMNYIVIHYFGMTFLSKPIDYTMKFFWNNNYVSSLIIDNLYIRFFVNYGIVLFVLLSIMIYQSSKKKNQKNAKLYPALIILLSLMAISEHHMLNAMIGFPLLFLCNIFEEGDPS
ncbi:MAG: hypothetical protein IKE70_00415 [Bacilli bacterium]|nr:hypothetical protein [Bacilli bacterium]